MDLSSSVNYFAWSDVVNFDEKTDTRWRKNSLDEGY